MKTLVPHAFRGPGLLQTHLGGLAPRVQTEAYMMMNLLELAQSEAFQSMRLVLLKLSLHLQFLLALKSAKESCIP